MTFRIHVTIRILMSEFPQIVRNPLICGGQPTIKGTRALVLDILDLLREGRTFKDILEGFPTIAREVIQEMISHAKALIEGEIVLYGTGESKVSAW